MKKVTENWEVDIYISEDGRRFRDEKECKEWEQNREDNHILHSLHSMELEIPILTDNGFVYRIWYLVRNERERDAIIRKYCNQYQYTYINGSSNGTKNDISVGDWIIMSYSNDNGEREYQGVYTLSWILEHFKEFIAAIEEATVSGKY